MNGLAQWRSARHWPLRRKLLLIILAATCVSLGLVISGIFAYELSTQRSRLANHVSELSRFIAANSAPTLAFDDAETAQEILFTLSATPEIIAAVLYRADGRPFAAFVRPGVEPHPHVSLGQNGKRFVGNVLHWVHPVEQKGRRLGTLYVRASTGDLTFAPYTGVLLVVALAIGGGAVLLQRLLRRMISEPLLGLSETAEKIAGGNLAATAPVGSDDEIGQLARTLNRMTEELARSYSTVREREQRLLLSQQAAGIGTFEWNIATHVIQWTSELEQLYGMAPGSFDGTYEDWEKRVHPDDLIETRRRIQESIETGTLQGEWRIEWPDGSVHWLSARGVVEKDEAGMPKRMLGVNIDITDRKEAEDGLRRLNAELEDRVRERTLGLEAANKELDAFAYSVSHDLKTPLRAIAGFTRIVLEDHADGLSSEVKSYLERVRNGAHRMGLLVDDLLALSRLGRQPLKLNYVAVDPLVRRCLAELREQQRDRHVDIQTGALGQCIADPALLEQVFMNLLSNALKYSRGRDPARIEVRAEISEGEYICSVADNGTGFDMRYADKLFGVFQRLHRTEDYEGTGVGLAIVRRIIERHSGRVWADAQPGQGATFFFSLPHRTDLVAGTAQKRGAAP